MGNISFKESLVHVIQKLKLELIVVVIKRKPEKNRYILGRNIGWKVFSFFCEYVYRYWKTRWNHNNSIEVYYECIAFLSLLIVRCTKFFPLKRYRIAIPKELRAFVSYIRAFTFRQIKTRDIVLKDKIYKLRKIAKKN